MTTKQSIAKHLLDIEAVSLSPSKPFTWASGLKSPIYCDNRITMSYPIVRKEIAKSMAELIKTDYPDAEVIAGTATAGIPHAAWAADILDLPMIYIRGKAKEHGKGNQIEGRLLPGQKVVVIEDLISTGVSVLEAASALISSGAIVLGVAAIFTYELPKGIENFKKNQVSMRTLTDYTTLTELALETSAISNEEMTLLKKWKQDPIHWND
ncbi:orotate phosphoribosyltransferase [Carnobacterium iners]|uniref:Orotate phosphoribosyltransferase n=1 Tax=Carnobacterium iners TaxID=1073423 RepID=A0A1X7NG53_9LACT|nr:orotate phosphoribosyltransferase [Carnobacterium iners]SEK38947.1 orotate phosphoribosyltransferase [Carnobacterium iners]SMH36318.1 orotate phosphoribosyltransferase [Carnobacterium iners]